MSKKKIQINEITKKLSKLATNTKIVTKQRKKSKAKECDEDTIKIQDTTWNDSSKEINEDEFESEDE